MSNDQAKLLIEQRINKFLTDDLHAHQSTLKFSIWIVVGVLAISIATSGYFGFRSIDNAVQRFLTDDDIHKQLTKSVLLQAETAAKQEVNRAVGKQINQEISSIVRQKLGSVASADLTEILATALPLQLKSYTLERPPGTNDSYSSEIGVHGVCFIDPSRSSTDCTVNQRGSDIFSWRIDMGRDDGPCVVVCLDALAP